MNNTLEKNTRSHCKLEAWKQAMDLTRTIYKETKNFPAEERFGLTAQLRRCAVSIPSNLAEGAGRGTRKEFVHFLHIARGSLSELETQCILANDFGYMDDGENITNLVNRVFQLICGLIRSLEKKPEEHNKK